MEEGSMSKFKYDGETMINVEDPNLTDEELVWERLLHGVREESLSKVLMDDMAEELRKEIDAEILIDIMKIAKNLDK